MFNFVLFLFFKSISTDWCMGTQMLHMRSIECWLQRSVRFDKVKHSEKHYNRNSMYSKYISWISFFFIILYWCLEKCCWRKER